MFPVVRSPDTRPLTVKEQGVVVAGRVVLWSATKNHRRTPLPALQTLIERGVSVKTRWAVAAARVALCMCAMPVLAHHSFSVQYDLKKSVQLKGFVTKVEWTNPHARFYVDVKDEKGAVRNWNFEIARPNVLIRNGWKPNTLKIGDEITVNGFEQRIRPTSGPMMAIAEGVTAADGRKLFASAQSEPAR